MDKDLYLGYCISLAERIDGKLNFTVCPEYGYSHKPDALQKKREKLNLHPNYHVTPVDLKFFKEECDNSNQPMFVCT